MRLALVWLVVAGCGKVASEPDAPGNNCPTGFDDCNLDPADGCEADLASVETCGACTNTCSAPTGSTPVCTGGTCTFTCDPSLIACGDACVDRCDTVFDTAGEMTYEVPASCTRLRIKAWGAGGGNGAANTGAAAGGYGLAELTVSAGDPFTVVVGAPGANAAGNAPGLGGAPGGGNGGSASSQGGGGGGGFSGVFQGAVDVAGAILIAGGGGGSGGGGGGSPIAGAGGGSAGQSGLGAGGTQTTGSGPLIGGPGGSQGSGDGGGGGGGGWYGGQGGPGANSDAGGAGGGSGFAAAMTTFQVLATGDRATPGSDTDADRGFAGAPGAVGKVVIDCIP